ncbi:MAG: nuclear transport factor 2 family protein [Pseudomonadota bacterium]|nr:nuclear transport factor 2 family protein [Pseudomonadota bacterium]
MRYSSISISLLLAIGGMFLGTAVIAGAHKTVTPMVTIDVSPEVEAAVTAVVYETAERWNSQDFSSVLELWDQNEPFPTYLAEEQAQWFVGWNRLRDYLDPPAPNPIIEVLREEMSKIQVNQIAPDLAIAIWEMHFEMKVRGSNPIGEDVRVSAVLRNTPEGWRYIHWVESPKATMVYIENLFEQGVAEGWDEYYKAAMQRKKEVWQSKRQQ